MIKRSKAAAFALAGILALGSNTAVMAATPTIARTRAWDDVEHTLGGVPESVTKMVFEGCNFYLAPGVTETNFAAVIAAGPEAVMMNTFNNGKLYYVPTYILWNSDKTVLLVHPLEYVEEVEAMEAVTVPGIAPDGLAAPVKTEDPVDPSFEKVWQYMLSEEYTSAMRNEFYRILNEYRAENELRELKVDPELEEYADLRAAEQRDLFGHVRPDGSVSGSGWFSSRKTKYWSYSENVISCGTLGKEPLSQAAYIFSRWKDSPGHNRLMLRDFGDEMKMAFGVFPELDERGMVSSGAVFAVGY